MNLLESAAILSKSAEVFCQITLLNFLKSFSCKIRDSHLFSCSGLKVAGFFIMSNLAVTTIIVINKSRANLFSRVNL